ncbi:YuzF family protein [Salipaludibacillus sp. CUR1]|uniref:YuzF family protein n=1 Tax=Salipaludibacillus sp. CUR1 TaxID=2820003 RepID=UPI001E5ECD6A|nr:YuzF family protein [Salipaludibacillus sp. CUR1]MCE7791485.1 YuzF family protein [Salipaludibacillus sp. CUR1]
MYYEEERNQQQEETVKYSVLYDPFVVQTLQSVTGANVVIQTCQGSVRGKVTDVKPDHVVIQQDDSTFFIRIQQIIWIMPT